MSVGILLFLTSSGTAHSCLEVEVGLTNWRTPNLWLHWVAATRRRDTALLSSGTNLSMSSVMLYIYISLYSYLFFFRFVCKTFAHAVGNIPHTRQHPYTAIVARTLWLHVFYINAVFFFRRPQSNIQIPSLSLGVGRCLSLGSER